MWWPPAPRHRTKHVPLPASAALLYRHRLEDFGDNPALLLRGEPGEHRERKHLGGCLLGNWEIDRTEAKDLIGLREMERDRVVDARSDACSGQILLELFSAHDSNNIEMVDRSRPRRHVRSGDRSFSLAEQFIITACSVSALLIPLTQMAKLHTQEARLDGVEPAIIPLDVVKVLPRLAMVAEH